MRTVCYWIGAALLIALAACGVINVCSAGGKQYEYGSYEQVVVDKDWGALDEGTEYRVLGEDPDALGEYDRSAVCVVEYALDDAHWPELTSDSEPCILTEPKGVIRPTLFWNLNNNPCPFTINSIHGVTYSDYMFVCDSKNSIAMNFGTLSCGGYSVTISLYEAIPNNPVTSWTGNPANYSGIGFLNLNPGTLYYFIFTVNYGTLSGSGTILYD